MAYRIHSRIGILSSSTLTLYAKRVPFRRGHHLEINSRRRKKSGKRIRNYRDCALSKLSGRTYNAPGEGDSEMDAGTIYANVMRGMLSTSGGKNQWHLIALVCFVEADVNGGYYSEREYSFLYELASDIQKAFEAVDAAILDARERLKQKIEERNEWLKW